ncbi:hypothetical protein HOY80DRAFT_1008548 [Tuber brumale]|nr:hypothetical protein HOY80DRAFT_1008548 [Tuber brumale]
MSECGLRECAFDRVSIQQAVVFGYQVCSRKGFIEFPYADDRITTAAGSAGGAPSFPMLDGDGDRMVFGSANWKILPEGSILVPAFFPTAGFTAGR